MSFFLCCVFIYFLNVAYKNDIVSLNFNLLYPYFVCFCWHVWQVLRFFPSVAGVPGMAKKSFKVGQYYIPAGSRVIANLWGTNHDERLWSEPHAFNPSRFGMVKKLCACVSVGVYCCLWYLSFIFSFVYFYSFIDFVCCRSSWTSRLCAWVWVCSAWCSQPSMRWRGKLVSNKPPLNRGRVGSHFLMRETQI